MSSTSPEEYRAMLLELLDVADEGHDPDHLQLSDLEEYVIVSGLQLPIVRLPAHYARGRKWFTNRGNVLLCNCGALWPCPLAIVEGEAIHGQVCIETSDPESMGNELGG